MANTGNSDKWYFTKEDLENTPSRKCGYDSFKELSHRQQAANFIQDMGQRLKVSQLCINTAIVYMHRFYVFHSFTNFPWYQMAAAALFLAAKVEEQPRKLEYVIRVANICRNPRDTSFDINSERYLSQSQDLVFNENILLQTLGFDFAIDHPHTHVVRCCHLVRASKDLAQTSYFMASNSLHLTTMCIQYKPTVVACFCILVACKWSNWEIPLSNEKKEWYSYVDPTVTADLLQQLTEEFLEIFETCPSRLKEKIMAISEQNVSRPPSSLSNSPFDTDPKKLEGKDHPALMHRHDSKSEDSHKHRSSRPHDPSSSSQSREQREREYKERKEREKMAAQRQAMMSGQSIKMSSSHHHRPPGDPKLKQHSSRPPSNPNFPQVNARVEPRDILREAARDSPFGLAKPIEKDNGQKRDYLMKPNVQTDPNNLNNYPPESRLNYSADNKQRVDPNRSRSAITNKHESALPQLPRKHDDQKPYLKSETDNIKKHLNAGIHDKNSAYLSKSSSSTSQKDKSPFTVDSMSKSVPRTNSSSQQCAPLKHSQHNGNGAYSSIPMTDNDIKIKQEPIVFKEEIKEEIPTPAVIKRPSLFSPEKTPPHKKQMKTEIDSLSSLGAISSLSPIISPEARRNRNYSSSSEPELRPVMKKIDQVEGFENLMRDNTIGMNKIHPNIPNMPSAVMKQEHGSIKQEYNSIKQEHNTINQEYNPIKQEYNPENDVKPQISANQTLENRSSHSAIVNGLETNPTLISNLLKEAPPVPHLPVVAAAENDFAKSEPHSSRSESKEKSHHKSKKKKEKHKNKDKDRNREDKEKKKKHKDKDREKHKHRDKHEHEAAAPPPTLTEPIKLKIQKDKIHLPADTNSPIQIQTGSVGLKIKIPKDKIRAESIADLPQPSLTMPVMATGSLKIKIPKEVINNCNNSSLAGSSSSRKRERDRSSPSEAPAAKVSKSRESKQNGRHSYNKVAQMGDGGSAAHRLAESKYTSKNSS